MIAARGALLPNQVAVFGKFNAADRNNIASSLDTSNQQEQKVAELIWESKQGAVGALRLGIGLKPAASHFGKRLEDANAKHIALRVEKDREFGT